MCPAFIWRWPESSNKFKEFVLPIHKKILISLPAAGVLLLAIEADIFAAFSANMRFGYAFSTNLAHNALKQSGLHRNGKFRD